MLNVGAFTGSGGTAQEEWPLVSDTKVKDVVVAHFIDGWNDHAAEFLTTRFSILRSSSFQWCHSTLFLNSKKKS